MLLQWID